MKYNQMRLCHNCGHIEGCTDARLSLHERLIKSCVMHLNWYFEVRYVSIFKECFVIYCWMLFLFSCTKILKEPLIFQDRTPLSRHSLLMKEWKQFNVRQTSPGIYFCRMNSAQRWTGRRYCSNSLQIPPSPRGLPRAGLRLLIPLKCSSGKSGSWLK